MSTLKLVFTIHGETYEFEVEKTKDPQNMPGRIEVTFREQFPQFSLSQPSACMCRNYFQCESNCVKNWFVTGSFWVSKDPVKPWIGENIEEKVHLCDQDGEPHLSGHYYFFVKNAIIKIVYAPKKRIF